MATTTPDNLWSPDGGDQYALTVDLAAMQDTTQAALTSIRSGLVMQRGTNAQRLALSGAQLFEGLHFWTTDTRLEWIYTASTWVNMGGGDTGWVDVAISSGYAAQSPSEKPQVRRVRGFVHLRGGWSNSGVTVSSTHSVGTIPAGFRPDMNVFGRSGTSTGASDASVLITSGGVLQLRTNSAISAYYFPAVPAWAAA